MQPTSTCLVDLDGKTPIIVCTSQMTTSFNNVTLLAGTANETTYTAMGSGKYQANSAVYGGLQEYFKVSPGKPVTFNGDPATSTSITFYDEESVVVNGVTTTQFVSMTVQIRASKHATPINVDVVTNKVSDFLTEARVKSMLLGAS